MATLSIVALSGDDTQLTDYSYRAGYDWAWAVFQLTLSENHKIKVKASLDVGPVAQIKMMQAVDAIGGTDYSGGYSPQYILANTSESDFSVGEERWIPSSPSAQVLSEDNGYFVIMSGWRKTGHEVSIQEIRDWDDDEVLWTPPPPDTVGDVIAQADEYYGVQSTLYRSPHEVLAQADRYYGVRAAEFRSPHEVISNAQRYYNVKANVWPI